MRNDYNIRPKCAAGEGTKKTGKNFEKQMLPMGSMEKPLKKEVVHGGMVSTTDRGLKTKMPKKSKMGD